MEHQNILEKIQKLLALQSSTSSEAEAQNCAARVQDLLTKYNLSLSMVDELKPKDKRGEDYVDNHINMSAYVSKHESDWAHKLLQAIARTNYCDVILWRTATPINNMAIVGSIENVTVVKSLFDYLVPTVQRLGKESFRSYMGMEKRNAYLRGFYRGCGERIAIRLKEQFRAQKEDKEIGAQVVALTIRNDEAIKNALEKFYPNLRTTFTKRSSLSGASGYSEGYAKGANVGLNKQIS